MIWGQGTPSPSTTRKKAKEQAINHVNIHN
jgi:hypothetical protein